MTARPIRTAVITALIAMGCSSSTAKNNVPETDATSPNNENTEPADMDGQSPADMDGQSDAGAASATLDPSMFLTDGLVQDISQTDCTLSGGTQTTCWQIVVTGSPANHDIGPFCPRNISDGADAGGMWIENEQTYDLSGAFIADLANFYNDPNWQLYDESTGDIYVTETQEACEGAARPDVAPEYQNHCVECDIAYVDGGTERTFLIPVEPVPTTGTNQLGRGALGVSLGGVGFEVSAPVDAILRAYTIAAFDDCGGHVNPFDGYHYHAVTDCQPNVPTDDGHAPLVGFALDGYGMYAMADSEGVEPDDLDECRGHSDEQRGYHYHVGAPGENLIIGCFRGEAGSQQ